MNQTEGMRTPGMGRLFYKFFHEDISYKEFTEAQKIMQQEYLEACKKHYSWPKDEALDFWLDQTFGKRDAVRKINTFMADYS